MLLLLLLINGNNPTVTNKSDRTVLALYCAAAANGFKSLSVPLLTSIVLLLQFFEVLWASQQMILVIV